jgi:hypothetical protein
MPVYNSYLQRSDPGSEGHYSLLQLRVLQLCFFQDGSRGRVCPDGEEIFVGGERPDAGAIGTLRSSCLPCIGASHS